MRRTATPEVLIVIVGRAGSKGLPSKNSLILRGRPTVCWTIHDAINAKCKPRVLVSTDGREIATAAREMGVDVIERPANLATDTATVDSAVRHAVEAIGSRHSIVVILYANVPVRPDDLVDRAVGLLVSTGADSVQSYCDVGKHHPYWMKRIDDDGRVHAYQENTIYRRQDLPSLLLPDGGVIAVTRRSLMTEISGQPHAFLGIDRRGIITKPGDVIDIDTVHDFAVASAALELAQVPVPMELAV